MNKVSSRKRDRLGRMLDSGPVYAIAALILLVLLASFYAVLLVNMNAIDTKAEDLKQHPYTVTVASGRTETLLMQIRTLDDRLAYTRTPETVASVKTDFAIIDTERQGRRWRHDSEARSRQYRNGGKRSSTNKRR